MKRFLKILAWTLGIPAASAILLAGGGYLWLRTSLPQETGARVLAGLTAPAQILRDADGLAHIRAGTTDDAYFSLGYAHAQDRLWQMEAMRRLGTGRLAEIGGATFLAQDRLMRTLGIGHLADAALARLSPEARAGVDAYTRGVNAWIDGHRGTLAPEFTLLWHRPEPWRPADCLIWGRIMALNLSGTWRRQLLRARLDRHLSAGAVDRLYPPDPADAPVTVAASAVGVTIPRRTAAPPLLGDNHIAALLRALPDAPAADGASNGWLVAGARRTNGQPLLANDPHLGFRAPNLWYLARIDAPGLTLAGATAPGVPFHILGHNGHIAWGMTTTGADNQDIVIEHLVPDDSTRYLAPEGPRAFTVRNEIIRVRGGGSEKLTVRETRNGPVVSDLAPAPDIAGDGTVLVLRSPVLAGDDTTAEALYGINRAQNWPAFTMALARFHAPVQNLFYADTNGHIGFSVAGRVPVRRGGGRGAFADGRRAEDDWNGFIAPHALPRSFDPPRGIIVNANNRVVGPGYPYAIARDWEAPYRAMRIEQLLARPGSGEIPGTREMQLDKVSLAARELLPVLTRLTPRTEDGGVLLDLLRGWDGGADRDRPQALIFTAWMTQLGAALFGDELGPLYDGFARIRPRLLYTTLSADAAWCDDVSTADIRETCPQMLARALGITYRGLARRYGPDPAQWRWGDAHRASFRDVALDWIPLLGALTRIEIATDGDDFTVNRGTSRTNADATRFPHAHGATLRAIFDAGDLDNALFSMPGGQSGNPISPHYRDLTRRWRDGAYLRLPARPAGPLRTLRLVPAPAGPPRRG